MYFMYLCYTLTFFIVINKLQNWPYFAAIYSMAINNQYVRGSNMKMCACTDSIPVR